MVKKKNYEPALKFLSIILIVISVVMLFSCFSIMDNLSDKKRELQTLVEEKEKKEEEIQELKVLLNTDKNILIEKAIREKLGYAYADEEIYRDLAYMG